MTKQWRCTVWNSKSTKRNMEYTFWNRKTPYEKEMERLSNMCHDYYLNMKER